MRWLIVPCLLAGLSLPACSPQPQDKIPSELRELPKEPPISSRKAPLPEGEKQSEGEKKPDNTKAQ